MKMDNYYQTMDWDFMLSQYPGKTDFDIKKYYSILSEDWPDFLDKYIQVPSMQRLQGVGLLCGTDWTSLYKNRFYYSRLNHSIGVALIVWHFTRDKIQTLAGLFHDIGKGVTTEFKKGNWHAYGHEIKGESITRRLLWDENVFDREAICSLVRWHMEPPFLFKSKDYINKIIDISKNIPSWYLLLLLKRCDIMGSHPSDMSTRDAELLKLDDISTITTKLGCYYKPLKSKLNFIFIGCSLFINITIYIGM